MVGSMYAFNHDALMFRSSCVERISVNCLNALSVNEIGGTFAQLVARVLEDTDRGDGGTNKIRNQEA